MSDQPDVHNENSIDEVYCSTNQLSVNEVIRRELPVLDGVYIHGEVQGVEVSFTVDTGATSTLISTTLYNHIPDHQRPPLNSVTNRKVVNANGSPMKCQGVATFDLKLGPVLLTKTLLVTDIEDEVLLGVDILQRDEHGPADLLLSEGKMLLRNQEVPLFQVYRRDPQARKVRAADQYHLPPLSECLIDVMVDPSIDKDLDSPTLMIEGDGPLLDRCCLAVASRLVNPSTSPTLKLRVMNTNPHPCCAKQDPLTLVVTSRILNSDAQDTG